MRSVLGWTGQQPTTFPVVSMPAFMRTLVPQSRRAGAETEAASDMGASRCGLGCRNSEGVRPSPVPITTAWHTCQGGYALSSRTPTDAD